MDIQQWVIVKASRSYEGGPGYTGPSWERAGLGAPRGFVKYEDAVEACERLLEVNAVGWRIEQWFPTWLNPPLWPTGRLTEDEIMR